MLTVHHLNDSRSQRILWLLEEIGVPYEIKKYTRMPDMLAPKELLAVNPIGKAPVISDGDINLAESGAIIEYIIHKYGNGKWKPTTDDGNVANLYYLHMAEGSLMPILVQKLVFRIIPQKAPFFLRPILNAVFSKIDSRFLQPDVEKFSQLIESHLSTREYFSGEELTAADFAMSFPLESMVAEKLAGVHTTEYVLRIQSRPAYKRALAKGGDYAYAANE